MWIELPPTPLEVGPLGAMVAGGVVRCVTFGPGRPDPCRLGHGYPDTAVPSDHGSVGDLVVATQLGQEVEAYFAGGLQTFSVPLDLDSATVFAQRVSRELVTVGFGETVTYGQLAAMAGRPRAARAVGSVMANNRWPLLVPCHRVVPASGGPGQFAGRAGAKEFLLAFEAHRGARS